MNEFRHAISDALHVAKYGRRVELVDAELESYTHAILAMPEMRSIKEALRSMAGHDGEWLGPALSVHGLPDSVIEWVLS